MDTPTGGLDPTDIVREPVQGVEQEDLASLQRPTDFVNELCKIVMSAAWTLRCFDLMQRTIVIDQPRGLLPTVVPDDVVRFRVVPVDVPRHLDKVEGPLAFGGGTEDAHCVTQDGSFGRAGRVAVLTQP